MGGHDPHTHLVPDLPMHQVFLHLESLKCSLLHGALQQRPRPAERGPGGLALPTGRLRQQEQTGAAGLGVRSPGPAAPLRAPPLCCDPITPCPFSPDDGAPTAWVWVPPREGGCFYDAAPTAQGVGAHQRSRGASLDFSDQSSPSRGLSCPSLADSLY